MISLNIRDVVLIFLIVAIDMLKGLTLIQLLWVNMVIDHPFATSLSFNPIDLDIIKKPRRKNNDVFINIWGCHKKEMGNKCLQMHNMIVIIKYSRIVGNNEQLKL
jgi:magnesium-transporting ATPase (P-type)